MATLSGNSLSSTYNMLLKTNSATGFSSVLTNIEDGEGNSSSLHISNVASYIDGKLGIGTSAPTSSLHITTSTAQPVLVEDSSGYDQFYVGDANSNFNVKLGDIDNASAGNDNYLFVDDSNNRIVNNTTYMGVNQTSPSATLHVGNNNGTVNFSLASSTTAVVMGSSANSDLFVVDTTNSEIISEANVTVENQASFRRSSGRYYLEEFFKRRPCVNADINSATEATREVANPDFEILGTNASSDDVTFSATYGGLVLQTDGSSADQVIILPHLDTNQTAWTGCKWGTENQVEWECAITPDISANTAFWAGLKQTNVCDYADDDDQAYFVYASGDTAAGALTTNANLHFIYSVAGTDFITNLGIAVAADTTYRLRIKIDSDRKVAVFVNDVQYGLVTSATAGGATQSTATQLSNALTNDEDFIPYIGIEAGAGEAQKLRVHYQKISRILFE
jgi:hypothetical protein